jgi:hypothetical protein
VTEHVDAGEYARVCGILFYPLVGEAAVKAQAVRELLAQL